MAKVKRIYWIFKRILMLMTNMLHNDRNYVINKFQFVDGKFWNIKEIGRIGCIVDKEDSNRMTR